MMKRYLDANIFINAILYNDNKAIKCKEIISKIVKNETEGVTSVLTWDEVVYVIKKLIGSKKAEDYGNKFLNIPNLRLLNTDKDVIIRAQQLVNLYDINPRDAIHAATALKNNVKEIVSDDSDFDKIKEIKRIKI